MKITDILIGKILLIGVIISASIVLLGGIIFLMQHGTDIYVNQTFSKSLEIFSVKSVMVGIIQFNARSLIIFGLSILFLTQLLRVILTALYFIEKKEFSYFWMSILVFAVLLYSILDHL